MIEVNDEDNGENADKKDFKDFTKTSLTTFPIMGFSDFVVKTKRYIQILEYKVLITDNLENNKNGTKFEKQSGSKPLEHDEIISKLNKNKIKLIIDKAPKIEKSILKDFIDYLINKMENFSEFEKAYSLYYCIFKNISYDSDVDIDEADYEKIYKNKKLNILYSKMYTHILKKLGLNIFDIKGYSKSKNSYHPDNVIVGFHYSWNILKVEENYYIINPSIYFFLDEREINDFYFCAKPEEFIWAYLPKEPKWQLLEEPITTEEFQKRVNIDHSFFKYLKSIDKIYSSYTIENENKFRLRFYKKNEKNKIYGKLFGEKSKQKENENCHYIQNLGCRCQNKHGKDYTDVICYFEKKNRYILNIFANDGSSSIYIKVAEFYFKYNK